MDFYIKISFIFLSFIPQYKASFEIVKYWNGVVETGEIGVIAVKANAKISECIWTHSDTGDEYSSEDSRSSRDIEISISEDDTLCKLKIKNADKR